LHSEHAGQGTIQIKNLNNELQKLDKNLPKVIEKIASLKEANKDVISRVLAHLQGVLGKEES